MKEQQTWYYINNRQIKVGPITRAELNELFNNKTIGDDTQVLESGSDNWIMFKDISAKKSTPSQAMAAKQPASLSSLASNSASDSTPARKKSSLNTDTMRVFVTPEMLKDLAEPKEPSPSEKPAMPAKPMNTPAPAATPAPQQQAANTQVPATKPSKFDASFILLAIVAIGLVGAICFLAYTLKTNHKSNNSQGSAIEETRSSQE